MRLTRCQEERYCYEEIHDYWWGSLTKVSGALGPSCRPLQNNALRYGQCLVAGSRGWTVPGPNTDGQIGRSTAGSCSA